MLPDQSVGKTEVGSFAVAIVAFRRRRRGYWSRKVRPIRRGFGYMNNREVSLPTLPIRDKCVGLSRHMSRKLASPKMWERFAVFGDD